MLWRLERGERLGLLDTLASSTTVVNALLSQVSLRRFSLVGCAIAVIWAWSPVGGQAALRIMTIGATEVVTPVIIHYLPMNSLMGNWVGALQCEIIGLHWPTGISLWETRVRRRTQHAPCTALPS